jgi:hypothetical protein
MLSCAALDKYAEGTICLFSGGNSWEYGQTGVMKANGLGVL